jgi:hypothetical protein
MPLQCPPYGIQLAFAFAAAFGIRAGIGMILCAWPNSLRAMSDMGRRSLHV